MIKTEDVNREPVPTGVCDRRRALLKAAGWMAPVILTVALPRNAFAQYAGPPPDPGGDF
jgi:hypothetical protein